MASIVFMRSESAICPFKNAQAPRGVSDRLCK
jgi:hypothetical protein